MYYVIHSGKILAAAQFSYLGPSGWKWSPGQILHFETTAGGLSPMLDDAFLAAPTGLAWHVEILAIAPLPVTVRDGQAANDGVTVRLLRKLEAPETILPRILQLNQQRVPAFESLAELGAA
jgi:hypothetical protein